MSKFSHDAEDDDDSADDAGAMAIPRRFLRNSRAINGSDIIILSVICSFLPKADIKLCSLCSYILTLGIYYELRI